jgi:hypothetical protein
LFSSRFGKTAREAFSSFKSKPLSASFGRSLVITIQRVDGTARLQYGASLNVLIPGYTFVMGRKKATPSFSINGDDPPSPASLLKAQILLAKAKAKAKARIKAEPSEATGGVVATATSTKKERAVLVE